MATGAQTWSTIAASNNSADGSVNWAEGMAPSAVNNSARAEMASAAMWIKDNAGALATTGTSAAYTVVSKQISTAVADGYTIAVNFHATNDAAATLNVDGIGAKKIQLVAGTNLSTGDILAGTSHRLHYSTDSTAWIIQGAAALGASSVTSDKIADGSVGYSKIQDETAGTILGNGGSTAAAPAELTLGRGLVATSNSISAPAFPPTSSFKNLSIKVATTTTVDCACSFVTLASAASTNFITLPCSGTINMASADVVNGLSADTVAMANSSIYSIWAIAATSTSSSGGFLAATSFTSPELPSGYAYKARLGAVVTTTTTAVAALYGTWQLGRRAQYVLGLAGTSALVNLSTGSQGNPTSGPTWITVSTTGVVPQTASHIIIHGSYTDSTLTVAPSTFYGIHSSITLRPPLVSASGFNDARLVTMMLEGTNVYYASNGANNAAKVGGWEDNI